MPRRLGSGLGILGLAGASLVVGLLLAEAAFRVLSGERVELHGMYTEDRLAGVGLTPGFHGSMQSAEFSYDVAINELGMRERPVQPRAPGTTRILVLGDSFVFGVGVSLEDSLPKAIERDLHAAGFGNVEVLNAGVPGYSPYQELQTLRKLAPVLRPDLLIQVVFMGDDWYGNEHRTPPQEVQATPSGWLLVHSALFRFVDRFVLSRLKGADHYEIHRKEATPDFRGRMRRVVDLLAETRQVGNEYGAPLLIALCPRYSQVYDDVWAKARFVYRLGDDYEPTQPNREFTAELLRGGFRVVDLLPPLHEEGRQHTLHFVVDGHMNVEGNQTAAGTITEAVRPLLARRS